MNLNADAVLQIDAVAGSTRYQRTQHHGVFQQANAIIEALAGLRPILADDHDGHAFARCEMLLPVPEAGKVNSSSCQECKGLASTSSGATITFAEGFARRIGAPGALLVEC